MPSSVSLITGVAGFIGSHLAAALLRRGERVVGVDNFDPFYPRDLKERRLREIARDGFHFVEADIRDRDAMSHLMATHRPRRLYHLAALAGVRPSIEQPHRYADVNVNGLVSVLYAARTAGCGVIVFASSSSVYGNNPKTPFAEDDPVDHPISPYAATKKAGELLMHTYARLFNLRAACLRFFTVYGPGQRPDLAIATFMRRMRKGQPITLFGDGSTSRDYTFIDDIIEGVLRAADRIEQSDCDNYRIWNLGGSAPITLAHLVAAIERVSGLRAVIERKPPQPGDVERTFADLSRSRSELGFEPRTPLAEGLVRQWAWLLDSE